MSWDTIETHLERWHARGDREAGRAALAFIETELRGMVPGIVRRTWPNDLVEDALHEVLLQLVESPLPSGIEQPRRYLGRVFRNRCIDLYEARRRRKEVSIADAPTGWEPPTEASESPAAITVQRERAARLQTAMSRLDVADRVVLTLIHAPQLLDDEEIQWLAARLGTEASAVRERVASAEEMHDVTRIFDPGDDDPADSELRRKRMERFRRRRSRASEKLRALLRELP